MDKLAAMSTFVKVVETGSFTRAAEVLGLPKARVSQRINDLEAVLGVRLLQRTTRTLNLTDDGRAYFDKCQLLLQQLDELEHTLRGGTRQAQGRLRVDSLVSIARWVIAPRLPEFKALHPGIDLRLGSSDRLSHMLEEGIDCAVRGGVLEDSSMVARHLCDITLGLYASPAFLGTVGRVEQPTDLEGLPRLTWFRAGAGNPFAWTLTSGAAMAQLEAGVGIQFDDPEVAIAACVAGAGICPGAPFAVAALVRAGLLAPVLPAWHFPARPVHLVYPSSRHLSMRLRCFVNWLLAVVEQQPDLRLTPAALASEFARGR